MDGCVLSRGKNEPRAQPVATANGPAGPWLISNVRQKMNAVEEKKKTSWAQIVFGILLFFSGMAALITGRISVDLGGAAGLNVRIAGASIAIVGISLVVLALR